jgi:hypothetical protein
MRMRIYVGVYMICNAYLCVCMICVFLYVYLYVCMYACMYEMEEDV